MIKVISSAQSGIAELNIDWWFGKKNKNNS
jgi:hypothetical protein